MSIHISVIPKKDSEGRERTYLRLSEANVAPFERELSPYDMLILMINLAERLKTEREYKDFEYHTEED